METFLDLWEGSRRLLEQDQLDKTRHALIETEKTRLRPDNRRQILLLPVRSKKTYIYRKN